MLAWFLPRLAPHRLNDFHAILHRQKKNNSESILSSVENRYSGLWTTRHHLNPHPLGMLHTLDVYAKGAPSDSCRLTQRLLVAPTNAALSLLPHHTLPVHLKRMV